MITDFLKYLIKYNKKTLTLLVFLATMGFWFFVQPTESLRFILRGFSFAFFMLGFLNNRTTSYDPSLSSFARRKKIVNFFLFSFAALLFIVPIFVSQWTELLLGFSFFAFGVYLLNQLRRNFFSLFDCLKTDRGFSYLIIFLIGVFLIVNAFWSILSFTDLLGSLFLLAALFLTIFYYYKFSRWR